MSDNSGVILEALDEKMSVFLENVEAVVATSVRAVVREELLPVKADIGTIKVAIKDTNREVRELNKALRVA